MVLSFDGIAHDIQLQNKIYNGLRPSIPAHVPKLIIELITSCWDDQPDKRPSSRKIHETISTWYNEILSNESTEIVSQIRKSDEITCDFVSLPSHVKIYSEAIYAS
ncbi:6188_t:CDS:2, partial [Racocetra fulgida]